MKIFRPLLGIVLGYLTMAVSVMIAMTLGAVLLGADRVFDGLTGEQSNLWIGYALALGVGAAFLGGIVATWWGGHTWAGYGLAAVLLVFGFLSMFSEISRAVPTIAPRWLLAATPIAGLVGALTGTSFISRRKSIK